MSQIAGGRADKCGNAFERLWIANLALQVVEGRAISIKWEPLGPEGAGIECVVSRPDGTREMHQCKIENGIKGKWSAADLGQVLISAKAHLESDLNARFVFVSRDQARVLDDLANRAQSCDGNARDFLKYCLSSKTHKQNYQNICNQWGLNSNSEDDAASVINIISRIVFCDGFWDQSEKENLFRLAESIVDGDGRDAVTSLGLYLEETLGNTHYSDELRTVLRGKGYAPLNLQRDPRVPEAIERLQLRFRTALEPHLICTQILSRPEPEQLAIRMLADGGARLIFVTGDAGSGKSGVLLQAIHLLEESRTPYLPIRLDTHYPEGTVRGYSKGILDLPSNPSACLQVLANERRAVLIIDQLDAVRWSSANSDVGWHLCLEIIEEALRNPTMTVVVVGRSVDFDDDQRIQHWRRGHEQSKDVEIESFRVGRIPNEVVSDVVGQYGIDYSSLLPRERELLSNAQNLQLWWRLAEDDKVARFSSRADLLKSFWKQSRDKAVQKHNIAINEIDSLLDCIVEYMDQNGRLNAPNILIDRHRQAADVLRSLGIIEEGTGTSRFAHQSYLDYLTVEKVFLQSISGEVTPIQWLNGRDQSLFRRDQVRFLLQLLRDQDPILYLSFLQDIFTGDDVRFHIQHLTLTSLAFTTVPSEGEYILIKKLWAEDDWHQHILHRVLPGQTQWLYLFTNDDTIPKMLVSDDENVCHNALNLCKRSAVAAPEWFEHILYPHWNSSDSQWTARIAKTLSYEPEHDTPTVFQWRLEWLRTWADDHEIYTSNQLAKANEARAIQHMAAAVEGIISNVERTLSSSESRRVELGSKQFEHLLNACVLQARLTWDTLLPVYKSVLELAERINLGSVSLATYDSRYSVSQLIAFSHDLLKASGDVLIRGEDTSFVVELSTLAQAPASAHLRRLVVHILASTPERLLEESISCFITIDSPLDIDAASELISRNDCLNSQDPAIYTLSKLSVNCSDEAFKSIESLVLGFHAPYERKSVELQLENIRNRQWTGAYPNHFGLSQYALLLALPEDRLSSIGKRVLRAWSNKFGNLSKYQETDTLGVRWIVSPIPSSKAKFVSDSVWLDIINRNWSKRQHKWRALGNDSYIEASPRNFASSLHEAGHQNPGRYIRLGLRFPINADKCYLSTLLRIGAIFIPPKDSEDDWAAASVGDIEALIEYISDIDNVEIAKSICHILCERSEESWQEATLYLIYELALRHSDPAEILSSKVDISEDRISSIDYTMLNSVRCSAVSAAAHLLWSHPELLNWAISLAEEVIKDPHPAVRAASFELAYAIARHDIEISCSLMGRAYIDSNICILGVNYSQHLLKCLWRRETELTPIFQQSMASSDDKTIQAACFWVTTGNIMDNLYSELASLAVSGSTAARIGVVSALVNLAQHQDALREGCLEKLSVFLNDGDEKVLDAANRIVFQDSILDTAEFHRFAIHLVHSAAFQRDPSAFLGQLREYEGSLLPFADAIEAAVSKLSEPTLRNATQSLVNRQGMAGCDISTILLRLYQHSERDNDTNLRSRCLDQWDDLLRAGVGAGQDVLEKLDSCSDRGEANAHAKQIQFTYHPA
jgi:hypothetical protein